MFWWRQLRRERITERVKALQELVPHANKVWSMTVSCSCYVIAMTITVLVL